MKPRRFFAGAGSVAALALGLLAAGEAYGQQKPNLRPAVQKPKKQASAPVRNPTANPVRSGTVIATALPRGPVAPNVATARGPNGGPFPSLSGRGMPTIPGPMGYFQRFYGPGMNPYAGYYPGYYPGYYGPADNYAYGSFPSGPSGYGPPGYGPPSWNPLANLPGYLPSWFGY